MVHAENEHQRGLGSGRATGSEPSLTLVLGVNQGDDSFKQAHRQLLIHAVVFHKQHPQTARFFFYIDGDGSLFGRSRQLQSVTNGFVERGAAERLDEASLNPQLLQALRIEQARRRGKEDDHLQDRVGYVPELAGRGAGAQHRQA